MAETATTTGTGPEAEILAPLHEDQRRAVTHGSGPLLVVAGAGTGKTNVITRRIAWLIASKKARPSEILALTFTDKAAAEMEQRVDRLVPYGYADVEISTFHSFGHHLLTDFALLAGLPGEPKVIGDAEARVLLRERLYQLPLDRLRPLPNPGKHLDRLLATVDRARDEAVSPEEYAAHAQRLTASAETDADREIAAEQTEIAAFYAAYLELLEREGFCDYGQQLWLVLRLLREHARVRRELGERYRYILVDEFQDTNVAQFEILRLLCEEHSNLTVVGDDDQSIYQFRGASFENLLHFLEAFPEATRVVLTRNYRSTQPILDTAYRAVRNNDPDRLEVQAQLDKRLVAARTVEGAPPPSLRSFDTAGHEAEWVAAEIRERFEGGAAWKDHAILVRSHLSAKSILQTLRYRDVPHRYAGNRGLYDTDEVRLATQALRAIADPGDSPAFYELAAGEIYGVPPADLAAVSGLASRRKRPLEGVLRRIARDPEGEEEGLVSSEGRLRATRLLADLDALREVAVRRPSGEVLYRFLERSGWLETLSHSAETGDDRKVQNLALFFDKLRDFGEIAESDRVPHFVRHLELLREAGENPREAEPDEDLDAVSVLTVHRAKGLEFPVVFLVDLIDGRFPGRRQAASHAFPDALRRTRISGRGAQEQEERRLFFVAMTRARDELLLSYAVDHGGKRRRKPSRFLEEALDRPIALEERQRSSALEALSRNVPDEAGVVAVPRPLGDDETLVLSYDQIDRYRTCPAQYRFAHVLRVPRLPHHAAHYGLAIHNAIRTYYRYVLNGWPVTLEDVLASYDASWQSEGFLTREHEEARHQAGRETLRRFFDRETKAGTRPHAVEREFRFHLGPDQVRGRFDRVDLRDEGPVIVDFKSSDVREQAQADKNAAESLQLELYALAYRETYDGEPVATELHYVESGLVGRAPVDGETFRRAREAVAVASRGIRGQQFDATPSLPACRFCDFAAICRDRIQS